MCCSAGGRTQVMYCPSRPPSISRTPVSRLTGRHARQTRGQRPLGTRNFLHFWPFLAVTCYIGKSPRGHGMLQVGNHLVIPPQQTFPCRDASPPTLTKQEKNLHEKGVQAPAPRQGGSHYGGWLRSPRFFIYVDVGGFVGAP